MWRSVAAALLAATATSACAQQQARDPGPVTERQFRVGDFQRIALSGAYDATVRTGLAPGVRAKGGEKLLDQLSVEVDGDTLKIRPRSRGFKWGDWSGNSKIALEITVPVLAGAELAGSGGLRIDKVTGDRFAGGVAGSGDLEVGTVAVESLTLTIAGSGDVAARSGRARKAEYEIAGSGDIDAGGVATDDASVSIAGSGGVRARASRSADVSIAGSGDVDIAGGARCSVSKAGSGNVRCH